MAERKTVTRQTMIGEGGIALISTRCLEMGSSSTRAGSITALTGTSISSTKGRGRC